MTDLLTKTIMHFLQPQLSNWYKGSIAEQRTRQEKSTRFFRLPKQIRSKPITIDGISSEWIKSPDSTIGTILYLHGGAYALGSVNTHRELVARLVVATKCNAMAVNYRLAPENPFPAALDDALKAYQWILAKGIEPTNIVIAGDSAGGGLAIAVLLALREKGISLPAGAFCFSPWLDLTLSGDSVKNNEELDPILSSSILKVYADYYCNGEKTTNPLISPLFADPSNLPPIFLQSGKNEILMDDSVRFYQKAKQAGVDATLTTWDDMFHVFQLIPFMPETQRSIELVSAFICHVIQTR